MSASERGGKTCTGIVRRGNALVGRDVLFPVARGALGSLGCAEAHDGESKSAVAITVRLKNFVGIIWSILCSVIREQKWG